jgi:hypothetical protein
MMEVNGSGKPQRAAAMACIGKGERWKFAHSFRFQKHHDQMQ